MESIIMAFSNIIGNLHYAVYIHIYTWRQPLKMLVRLTVCGRVTGSGVTGSGVTGSGVTSRSCGLRWTLRGAGFRGLRTRWVLRGANFTGLGRAAQATGSGVTGSGVTSRSCGLRWTPREAGFRGLRTRWVLRAHLVLRGANFTGLGRAAQALMAPIKAHLYMGKIMQVNDKYHRQYVSYTVIYMG